MDYQHKYLKYKSKYLHLKAGSNENIPSHVSNLQIEEQLKHVTDLTGLTNNEKEILEDTIQKQQKHIKYALDEYQQALLVTITSLHCCYQDFVNIGKEFVLLQEYSKKLKIDLLDHMKLTYRASQTSQPLTKLEERKVLEKMIPFTEVLKNNLEKLIDYVDKNIKTDHIKKHHNMITPSNIYQYFKKNYLKPTLVIFHYCHKILQQIQQEVVKRELPYIKFNVNQREEACDQTMTHDCYLLILSQKLPRLLMPFGELVKVCEKIPKEKINLEQLSKLQKTQKYISGNVSKMNEIVRAIEEHNKKHFMVDYLAFYLSQTEDIKNYLICTDCDKKDKKNKKICCVEPCNYNMLMSTCKYKNKQ